VPKGKAAEFVAEHDALYFRLRESVHELAQAYDGMTAARALASFMRLYRAAETAYTSGNHADGMLDYDDLEIYAYRLLDGPHAARVSGRVEERILHYLVDEFQDTGELQWGLVERLNSEVFAGEGAEGMRAPTLFVVGDKKQSIYRFRKANYRLMDVLRKKMEEGVDPSRRDFPELDYNFRSAPEILTVVDEVFKALMEDYRASRPYRTDAKGSVRLRLVPVGTEADALTEEVEAAFGAAIFGDGKARPARYGDMAVLIRTRAGLKSYEKALGERGIPFKVVGGTGFFYQDEVQALINILRYLDNSSELLPLAAALKSPLYSLTDIEVEPLFKTRNASAVFDAIGPETAVLFAVWREIADLEPVGALLDAVVRGTGALPVFGYAVGPSAVLNIEKLKGIARDYDARGGAGLSGFIEWVKAYRDNAEMATADMELREGDDFVSIMTVHTAKGLEFPVVFLPGAARGTSNTVDDFLLEEDEDCLHTLGIRTKGLLGENETFKHLKEIEKNELFEESKRLLYVAMTRAMDHLVIIGEDRRPANGTWLDFLNKAAPASLCGLSGEPLAEGTYSYPEGPRAHIEGMVSPAKATAAAMPPDDRLRPLQSAASLEFRSPSGMAIPIEDSMQDSADTDPFLRGTILHRALEAYGRTGRYDIPAIAKTEPGFVLLGGAETKAFLEGMETALSALFADDAINGLFAGPGRYFELPLLLRRGGEIISGAADLVIIEGGRASVIDFKTGYTDLPEADVVNAYSPQLLAYAKAVREAFGVSVVECYILLVDRVKIVRLPSGQPL
jgi:ATP-dependent helicase/nuclease subunit A